MRNLHALFLVPSTLFLGLSLGACAAPTEEATGESADEVGAAITFDLRGTTSLRCDAGDLCTLSASVYAVDGGGRKIPAFADYLAGEPTTVSPTYAAECALAFRGQAIGRGYYKSPMGCGLPRAGAGYAGELWVAYSLSRAEIERVVAQNLNLSVKSHTGKSKFTMSIAITPSLLSRGGTAFHVGSGSSTETDLPATAYGFSFERTAQNALGLRVRHTSSGAGRWVRDIHSVPASSGPTDSHMDTLYQVEDAAGSALFQRSGYASILEPRVFVDEAISGDRWSLLVKSDASSDYAEFGVTPQLGAAPYALGTQGGREGYSNDPSDTTGLSGCRSTGAGAWACRLAVKP